MTPAEFRQIQFAAFVETIVAFCTGVALGLALIGVVFWVAL